VELFESVSVSFRKGTTAKPASGSFCRLTCGAHALGVCGELVGGVAFMQQPHLPPIGRRERARRSVPMPCRPDRSASPDLDIH
jgi:hypothetical protein